MSCLKCIKRFFGIKEEQNDISLSKNRDKSKYIKGFNDFIINENY